MYTVYLTNFQYELDKVFYSFEEAFAYGKSKGFEFVVYLDGEPVGAAFGPGLQRTLYA